MTPRLIEVEEYFGRQDSPLRRAALGGAPEEVVVFEIVDTVDAFVRAVRRTSGMEWLVETDEFRVSPDDDFAWEDDRADPTLPARLYLILANQTALNQLRVLWDLYLRQKAGADEPWPYGLTPWRDLFDQLRDVRVWGPQDRMLDTGLAEDWAQRLRDGSERIPAEIELWFRETEAERDSAAARLRVNVESVGGQVRTSITVSDIGYHGMLIDVPAAYAQRLVDGQEVDLLLSGAVMFLRPTAQFAAPAGYLDDPGEAVGALAAAVPGGFPRVALLDGAPLTTHTMLAGRLILNDPDGLENSYQAGERKHGTGMASAVIHGDLLAPSEPLSRPVYVRPIMRPDANHFERPERMPDDSLAIDILYRAVLEMFEGEDAAAPTVRIIGNGLLDTGSPLG